MAAKTLGFADLFFYAASMSLSIRWISVAAAAGPASLWIWVLAVVLFSGPLIVATAELTTRFAGEGGVYVWTEAAFGQFWGFLCGWLYWTSNLPFFSGVLVFMLNLLALAIGPPGRALIATPWLFTAVAVALSVAVGAVHYVGLGTGKWLSNVGGTSNIVLVGLLAVVGALVVARQGSATNVAHASYAPPLNADGAILWATMVFPSAAARRWRSCATMCAGACAPSWLSSPAWRCSRSSSSRRGRPRCWRSSRPRARRASPACRTPWSWASGHWVWPASPPWR